ncbi:MAG: type II toxin-antitoxin system Phd/YefM family antitoxin [Anaerolineales bacterium]|nr:type II toxin-antitoxin system Phd/YefM family antitoxin [Anaerolineales bacterium]MCW5854626.1 type II toxin-antitoxin system Phd/YefM family antitoxin [Anaerolineales bacterium]
MTEAHRRLSILLSKLGEGPITLTRRGKPVAVLLATEEYERLHRLEISLRFQKTQDRLARLNADVPEDELAADIRSARQSITDGYLEQLRGSLKGGNALETLMREREWERSRDG